MSEIAAEDRRAPELLAPAGGPESLRAAVHAGADAVYLGMKDLNARRGAENFDASSFAEACRYAHVRGARVYLTANVLVRQDELTAALRLIDEAWFLGADAVILQDLGLVRAVRKSLPEVRIHASTQIGAHNLATVRTLAGLGVSRVTLARETSLSEIAAFARDGGAEVESFVHGALCFCYSGQCLLSSVVGGRSANRGLCAQPCRLSYALVDPSGVLAETPGAHLLSPRDLAGIDLLPGLAQAGVAALKIEGRMKSPEYVALVTGVYRAALDRSLADPEGYSVLPSETSVLEEAFSRGFTAAYLEGVSDDSMMSYRRPNNRGVPVGRVSAPGPSGTEIAFDKAVESDDTIEVWTSEGRFAQRVGPMTVRGVTTNVAPAGTRAGVRLDGRARPGDRVFRVASAALLEAARRLSAPGSAASRVPADVEVRVRVGELVSVRLRARGAVGAADGPVVEAARTKTVTASEVMEHVGRLGSTPFEAASWELDLDPAAGVGFSVLHSVRRDAAAALEAALSAAEPPRRSPSNAVAAPPATAHRRSGAIELVVSAWSEDVAAACLSAGADRALLHAAAGAATGGLTEPLLPRVAHDAEAGALLAVAAAAGRATVGNLGSLAEAAREGVRTSADWPVNVMNSQAAACLQDLGAGFVWASPELSGRQLAELAAASPVPVGALAYGRVEVMVAEHCVLQAAGACSHECAGCARRAKGWWRLRDAKGYEFPVMTDPSGRAHLVNSATLDLSRALDELVATGIAALRLDFTVEVPDEAARVTAAFRSALDAVAAGGAAPAGPVAEGPTTGHFFRGVR